MIQNLQQMNPKLVAAYAAIPPLERRKKIERLSKTLRLLYQTCVHMVAEISGDYYTEDEWRSDDAYCIGCKTALGWYCPKSPDHFCHYEKINSDCCDFCGQPDERK